MMIKFIDVHAEKLSHQPKAAPQRACVDCRRRKKRCQHGTTSSKQAARMSTPMAHTSLKSPNAQAQISTNQDIPRSLPGANNSTVTHAQQPPEGRESKRKRAGSSPRVERGSIGSTVYELHTNNKLFSKGTPNQSDRPIRAAQSVLSPKDSASSRFVGDMNPEGVFLAATSPSDVQWHPGNRNVGIWLSQKPGITDRPALQEVVLPILEKECLSAIPKPEDCRILCNIYFQRHNKILPIIDKTVYESMADGSPEQLLLQQGMCLVASAEVEAVPYLTLQNKDDQLSVKEFARHLFAAMRLSIDIEVVTNKTVMIQALGLMVLYMQGRDGLQGSETSSILLAKAVCYVYAKGLHIESHVDTGLDRDGTLLCCIWAIDRINAAFEGKPVHIHERDIGKSLRVSFDKQEPAFRLLLYIVELLDQVIGLYRPQANKINVDENFPTFEDLVLLCAASRASSDQLATLEIFYHAVSILSCRLSTDREELSHQGYAKLRQTHSAERVTALILHQHFGNFISMPLIPYTLSLSMSVSYRSMRRSVVPLFRARARDAFEIKCHLLKTFGHIFWSAELLGDLGQQVLDELDRAVLQSTDDKVQEPSIIGNTRQDRRYQGAVGSISTSGQIDPSRSSVRQENNPFLLSETFDIDPFELIDAEFDLGSMDAYLEGNLDLAYS